MSEFAGNFADYLSEAKSATPILLKELDLELPVPTRKQLRDYYAAQTNEALSPAERGDASWKALLGKHHTKVIKYFDDRPFTDWDDFSTFVGIEWFGRGADEVEGK